MTMRDRQYEIAERFDDQAAATALALVDEGAIQEHALKPRGPHSTKLHLILRYLRRAALPNAYIITASRTPEDFRVALLVPLKADPSRLVPKVLEDLSFRTEEAAMHKVFTMRLADLQRKQLRDT
jgi:hypothetical protein